MIKTIEVYHKAEIRDVFGLSVKESIAELGVPGVKNVRVSGVYRFAGAGNPAMFENIAKKLLVDPIIQQYNVVGEEYAGNRDCWVVGVWYRKGVTDMVAETVRTALGDVGIKAVFRSIATGKRYYLYGSLKRKEVVAISNKLLVNALIHKFSVKNLAGKDNEKAICR